MLCAISNLKRGKPLMECVDLANKRIPRELAGLGFFTAADGKALFLHAPGVAPPPPGMDADAHLATSLVNADDRSLSVSVEGKRAMCSRGKAFLLLEASYLVVFQDGNARCECVRLYRAPDAAGPDVVVLDLPGGPAPFNAAVFCDGACDGMVAVDHEGQIIAGCTFVPKHPPLVPWTATDAEVQAAGRTIGPVVLPRADYLALEAASRVCTNRHQWQATVDDGSIVKVTDGKMWSSSTPDPATYKWVPVLCGGAMPM